MSKQYTPDELERLEDEMAQIAQNGLYERPEVNATLVHSKEQLTPEREAMVADFKRLMVEAGEPEPVMAWE